MTRILALFLFLTCVDLMGQKTPDTIESFYFWPNYSLPGNATNHPGNTISHPVSRFDRFTTIHSLPTVDGHPPDDYLVNMLSTPLSNDFSIELWLLHHVNKPFSTQLLLHRQQPGAPACRLLYTGQSDKGPKSLDVISGANTATFELKSRPFQEYWHHLVISREAGQLSVYHNGTLQGNVGAEVGDSLQISLAGYFHKEPFLKLDNVVKRLCTYRGALSPANVKALEQQMHGFISKGIRHESAFHFMAGPYLHYATQSSINLIWETNKPSTAVINYGQKLPLESKLMVNKISTRTEGDQQIYIYEATIDGLSAQTKYFYNIALRSFDGEEMESGSLSFQTAVPESNPYMFALIGDTETRPHINDRVAKLIWGERPDFVVHLGDLTDGGKKPSKWQWNYEYFEGIGQLHQRIPVYPVAGNGEGDLYWYARYHRLPDEQNEDFYSFEYGNASFFMLNSNARKKEFTPGGRQWKWLDEQLAACNTRWKFVAMHHAPYSTDENDYGDSYSGTSDMGDKHVQQMVPLFEKHHVDVVFFGHLHSYSRMGPIADDGINEQKGVWYIQAGGAGGNLEDFAPTRAWFSQKTYVGHHHCMINIMGDEFILKMYDLSGALRDYFTINKN